MNAIAPGSKFEYVSLGNEICHVEENIDVLLVFPSEMTASILGDSKERRNEGDVPKALVPMGRMGRRGRNRWNGALLRF